MRNRSVGLLRVGKKSQPCTAAQEHGVFHGIDEVRGFRLRDVTDLDQSSRSESFRISVPSKAE